MKMEFGKHEKSIAIIVLHKRGLSHSEDVILLKPLGINCLFVFRTVKQYNKMSDIVDGPREGRPYSVHPLNVIHAVCECVKVCSPLYVNTNEACRTEANRNECQKVVCLAFSS